MLTKFKWMSRQWQAIGLKYPTGPTFRLGLATIFVASKTGHTYSAVHAHPLFEEFVREFRSIRSVHIGQVAFKSFPPDVDTFKSVYPGLCDGAVTCRVDARLIREMATKEHIPIKTSNKKISFKQCEKPAASSDGSSPRSSHHKELMDGLLANILSCRTPSNSPPPGRRPTDADLADTQARDSCTLPIGSAVVHTVDGGGMRQRSGDASDQVGHMGQGGPSATACNVASATAAAHEASNANVGEHMDRIDSLMGSYLSGKKGGRRSEEKGCDEV